MHTQTPALANNPPMPNNQKQKDAYEETDSQLIAMEGLLAALDILEDQLEIINPQSRSAKAFWVLNRLMRETMETIWETRKGEWASLGGKFVSDDKAGAQ